MEKSIIFPMILNLQLFAEGAGGGDGGTGAEGASGVSATAAVSQTKGAKANPLANVKYGIQEEATTPAAEVETVETEDRNARYEAFIKEHKDLDDARIQNIVQKRLKGTKETVEKYEALDPTLEALAKKYGVDASDIKAINKAIEEDDSYYEEEALEKGISVQQLKEIRKMERENADLKRQMEEQNRKENANKLYAKWMDEAESTKAVYPSFDLNTEMQNPKFIDLLRSNIDVRTAFEVLHKDEIIPAAMQYTAKTVEQKLTNKMIANGARPVENGNSSQSAAITKSDVSQLSKEDRAEINRRVARGEKITFSR
jgi:hypothetical protein